MLPAPPNAPIAGVESLVLGAIMLVLGFLVATVVLHLAGVPDVGPAVRWGLALPGLIVFVLMLSLLHIATRGWLLSSALAVWGIVAVAFAGLGVTFIRARRAWTSARPVLVVMAALVALGFALWTPPLFMFLPSVANGDINLHMGWASQILNGEVLPSAPIVGDIPNYYPWLYHMAIAFLAHFTPGGSPFHAINTIQVVLIGGVIMSLFALGRVITERSVGGVAVALMGGLAGGFGWLVARGPTLLIHTRQDEALAYWGDFFATRSYNFAFHNITPAFPRDLSYVLLPGLILLITLAARHARARLLVFSGVVLGCIGLIGAEAFFVALGAAGMVILLPGDVGRARRAAALLIPGLGLWSLWLAPLLLNMRELGFESLAHGPVILPWWAILGAWGVVTPVAAVGLVRSRSALWDPRIRGAAALLFSALLVLIASAVLPRVLGEAFTTLGFQHRYWPLVCLGLAVFAGPGAVYLFDLVRQRGRAAAVVASGAVILTAVASPLLGSVGLDMAYARPDNLRLGYGVLERSLRGEDTVLTQLRSGPEKRCTVAAPSRFAFRAFSHTGYRMLILTRTVEETRKASELEKLIRTGSLTPLVAQGPHFRNLAHLRWSRIHERIPSDVERAEANLLLTRGDVSPEEWDEVAARFGVDAVVALADRADAPAFAGRMDEIAVGPNDVEMAVMWVGDCGARSAGGL